MTNKRKEERRKQLSTLATSTLEQIVGGIATLPPASEKPSSGQITRFDDAWRM
jgi:hypothetical protein